MFVFRVKSRMCIFLPYFFFLSFFLVFSLIEGVLTEDKGFDYPELIFSLVPKTSREISFTIVRKVTTTIVSLYSGMGINKNSEVDAKEYFYYGSRRLNYGALFFKVPHDRRSTVYEMMVRLCAAHIIVVHWDAIDAIHIQ
jgi:hypothetical protein